MKLFVTLINFIAMILFAALSQNFVVQTAALIIAGAGMLVFTMFDDSDDGDDGGDE